MEVVKNLTRLIYVSNAVQHFSGAELLDLLTTARAANESHQVTGLLLYKYGDFMQVIEGESKKIDQLMDNIQRDARHSCITIILKESIIRRDFADWTMGFRNITDDQVSGFSDFFVGQQAISQLQQGKAKAVLLGFKGS